MHNLFCENDFYLHGNKKSFSFQRLSTEPHFDTEGQGNSEMAYWLKQIFNKQKLLYPDQGTNISLA